MTHPSEVVQHRNGELKALGFDLPVWIIRHAQNFLSNVENTFSVKLGDGGQYIQSVNSDAGFWVADSNQRVVQKHIKPLLIELLLVANQVCVARINNFVIFKMLLQTLDHFDSHLQVVTAVSEDQLTDVRPFVRIIDNQVAVIAHQMTHEELIEFSLVTLMILLISIDFLGQTFNQEHCIQKTVRTSR